MHKYTKQLLNYEFTLCMFCHQKIWDLILDLLSKDFRFAETKVI